MPFLLFFPAAILATFFGGWRAGLTCAVLSAASATYFFLSPSLGFLIPLTDTVRLVIFALVSILIVGLIWSLQTVSQQLLAEREHARLLAGEETIGSAMVFSW